MRINCLASLWILVEKYNQEQTQSLTSDALQVKDFKELLKTLEILFTFLQCEYRVIGRLKGWFAFTLQVKSRTGNKAKHS